MKSPMLTVVVVLAAAIPALLSPVASSSPRAVNGEPYIHDPSTVIFCEGKYYTFGTGGGPLISEDGWTWHGGAQRPGGGVPTDVIRIGDRYYMAYARGGGGMSGGHAGDVKAVWTRTLDPKSPDFSSDSKMKPLSRQYLTAAVEICDAIDPVAFLLDPTTRVAFGWPAGLCFTSSAWWNSTPKRVAASPATRP